MSADRAPISVLVSVGTAPHRFDRLMGWIERWAATAPDGTEVLVQRGVSRAPDGVPSVELMSPSDLRGHIARADAVVVQGGPGGMFDCLHAGRRPIMVPRDGALDEHVDSHQVPFARHMARQGVVLLAEDEAELVRHLDRVVADPTALHIEPYTDATAATALRVGAIVDEVVAGRRRRPPLPRRLGRRLPPAPPFVDPDGGAPAAPDTAGGNS